MEYEISDYRVGTLEETVRKLERQQRRRKITFMPQSSREREAKPSAAMFSLNPKCSVRKALEAGASSTFSDTADVVIFTELLRVCGGNGYIVLCK